MKEDATQEAREKAEEAAAVEAAEDAAAAIKPLSVRATSEYTNEVYIST